MLFGFRTAMGSLQSFLTQLLPPRKLGSKLKPAVYLVGHKKPLDGALVGLGFLSLI